MTDDDFDPVADEEAKLAGAEAARIGGGTGVPPEDPADAPIEEAGEGESEGFEQAEEALIENATHGDQHAARRVLEDAPDEDDDARATGGGEADQEIPPDQG